MVISEPLLNGILHLFALLSACYDQRGRASAREIVDAYLSDYLGIVKTDQYIGLFDAFLAFYDETPDEAFLISQTTVICENLKGEIPRSEQYVVLLRFLELAHSFQSIQDDLVQRLASAAGTTYRIEADTIRDMLAFLYQTEQVEHLSSSILYVHAETPPAMQKGKFMAAPHFAGGLSILHIEDINTLFCTPHKGSEITLNGIAIRPGAFYMLPPGAILRDVYSTPLYYADLAGPFKDDVPHSAIRFQALNADFRYPGSDNGLHDFSFDASGGQMIGVMGGSGVGKSTLINILNGNLPPATGKVLLNGRDLFADKKELEGMIGLVPQDDLLFEELSVYQNLYYSSRLCLAELDPSALEERVCSVLEELNQLDTRDLKVGSPLEKTISGGQRKRLNIALELIREPAVLFVDEPTSGLSSADSLNVMTLLKEQAAQGKLIIVIIHQPSSDIFKMFDQLWILDQGGRPIFTGNPLDAVLYFRKAIWQAGTEECLCPRCGNVNPEQIFDIIEMKRLDEYGYTTAVRHFSPEKLHQRYRRARGDTPKPASTSMALPDKTLQRPGLTGQLAVFFKRTLLARLTNHQYLAVNLLEAPLLAWVIAAITKFEKTGGYQFSDNHNIPIYFFMSVVVALFMGLSVSAEEIIRDRKILRRERFLHLSWFSYVDAKVLYLAIVAAIQMGLYVLVGNTILGIPEFSFKTWLVLFSCAMCASMIGLNISAAFKSVVTIYILIPMLLVPQIILGGMVVPFDDLISPATRHNRVPFVGNLMPSRWGFEAIVVEQFRGNPFQAPFNDLEHGINSSDYVIDYYVPELLSQIDFPFLKTNDTGHAGQLTATLKLLRNEFDSLAIDKGLKLDLPANAFTHEGYNRDISKQLKTALSRLVQTHRQRRTHADEQRRTLEAARIAEMGAENYRALEKRFQNKSLIDVVRNRDNLDDYRLADGRIVRLSDPIFSGDLTPWGGAPFFAGSKRLGRMLIPTYWFDLALLWVGAIILYAMLYGNLLQRLLQVGEKAVRQLGGKGRKDP